MTSVRFVVPDVHRSGGVYQAATRLATALTEAGLECDMVTSPSDGRQRERQPGLFDVRTLSLLTGRPGSPQPWLSSLRSELGRGSPDLLIVGQGNVEILEAAREAGPTALHAHMNWPACPDASRYWNRAQRSCTVHAGAKCLALRPLLGCTSQRAALAPLAVVRWRRLSELLETGSIPVIAISGPQATLLREHGVPAEKLCVVPNLGMRMGASQIERAATQVDPGDHAAVAFFGRLTKVKGALLLPEISRAAPSPGLRVFGDGYLRARLGEKLKSEIRGDVPQDAVAGILAWARSVVVPSLWPEPGGIVGIDAQLFGVPTAGFALGAPLDWPAAALFAPGDSRAMSQWVAAGADVPVARDVAVVAARQRSYWTAVGRRAAAAVRSLLTDGRFEALALDAVTADLETAGVGVVRS